jgi:tRNA pseudouridine32 synthase / 23S rRNA pseudouridine746 synthase
MKFMKIRVKSKTMQKSYFIKLPSFAQTFDLPLAFTFPFYYEPHPLAQLAANQLQQELVNYHFEIGKMFGVLVVKDQNHDLGFLTAYSGSNFPHQMNLPFVPLIYDHQNEKGSLLAIKTEIHQIHEQLQILEKNEFIHKLEIQLQKLSEEKELELFKFKQQMQLAKKLRHQKRLTATEEEKNDLVKESLHYKHQFKTLAESWESKLYPLQTKFNAYQEQKEQLKELRKKLSSKLQEQYFKNYKLLNANQEEADLLTIFKTYNQTTPPTGSGDCAAPKLLQFALKHNYQPLCLAEFWWGPPHKAAIRKHGLYYPACTGKCRPILEHMLQGLKVDDNPMLSNPAQDKEIEILYEDDNLMVIDKPSGLLSVPGKMIKDSVQTRLTAMAQNGDTPLLVHRLDQETSGILLVAKGRDIHKKLQQQFIKRSIKKRYCALLSGKVQKPEGLIELPLRMDLDNHPSQLVCFQYGKEAITKYEVIEQNGHTTKVHFYPLTGRTHQLRVHAAHADGLNCPIVGDDIYGIKDKRLMLHAQWLEFVHPTTHKVMTILSPSPF